MTQQETNIKHALKTKKPVLHSQHQMFSGKPSLTHKKDSCWPLICQGLCISTRTQQERVRRSLPIFYPRAKITVLQWTEYFQEKGKPPQKWGQQQWLFHSSVAAHEGFIYQQFDHLHPKPHLPSPFLSNPVLGASPPCADMHFPSHSWRELLPTEKPQTESFRIHDFFFSALPCWRASRIYSAGAEFFSLK